MTDDDKLGSLGCLFLLVFIFAMGWVMRGYFPPFFP